MKTIPMGDIGLEIHPISESELEAVLQVYQQCEDFLALGPVARASMQMVQKDLEISEEAGGIFCGIYKTDGEMIGVIDYVPCGYEGDPSQAFLELLMISAPFRKQGIGKAVVDAIESEIRKNPMVRAIISGVQVNNPQAIQFWQRNGYRITSGPKEYPDQTTAYDLRKDIN